MSDHIAPAKTTLMSFEKDGKRGEFDIVDGKFDYTGDLPVTDAGRMLFETLALNISEWWLERAAVKPATPETDLIERLRNALEDIDAVAVDHGHFESAARTMQEIARKALASTDLHDENPLTPDDLALIDQAWENHKAALPVAVIVNDNQPGRTAIIEITIDPPTLDVGTKLYAEPKAIDIRASITKGGEA